MNSTVELAIDEARAVTAAPAHAQSPDKKVTIVEPGAAAADTSEPADATKKCCAKCSKDVRCMFYCCIASWSCFLNSIECCCLGCSRCCLCCSDCALGCNRCLEQCDCDGH